jgi:hypothetical protein
MTVWFIIPDAIVSHGREEKESPAVWDFCIYLEETGKCLVVKKPLVM